VANESGSWIFPNVRTFAGAKKAAYHGAAAAFLLTALLTLATVGSLFVAAPGQEIGAQGLFLAFLYAVLGIGIASCSRVAAFSALALYVIDRYIVLKATGSLPALWLTVIIVLLFASGIRGVLGHHDLREATGRPYRMKKRLLLFIVTMFLAIAIAAAGATAIPFLAGPGLWISGALQAKLGGAWADEEMKKTWELITLAANAALWTAFLYPVLLAMGFAKETPRVAGEIGV
jgi:hypothetical protein